MTKFYVIFGLYVLLLIHIKSSIYDIYQKTANVYNYIPISVPLSKPCESNLIYKNVSNINDLIYSYVTLPVSYDFGSNSIPLVVAALATTGDILELGIGIYSTPLLHKIAVDQKRKLVSVETNKQWLDKFILYNYTSNHEIHRVDFNDLFQFGSNREWGLVLVDHANATSRVHNIKRFAFIATMVVVHDAEDTHEDIYLLRKNNIYSFYRYACKFSLFSNIKSEKNYTSTLILSNYVNMTEINRIFKNVKTDYGHAACDLNY